MLFATDDQRYFFLIPDDVTLPQGEFKVYSILGQELAVNPAYIGQYLVSKDEAQEWVQERLKEGAAQFGEFAKDFLNTLIGEWQSGGKHPRKSNYNLDFAGDLLGEQPEDLAADSEVATRGWERLLGEIGTVLQAAKSGNFRELKEASAITKGLGDILRKHGIEVSEEIEDLPWMLHERYKTKRNETEK